MNIQNFRLCFPISIAFLITQKLREPEFPFSEQHAAAD
jgi:hypothetical protein